MMRNASWHFGSSSQQPREHSKEQGAGLGGGQEINFAVSIVSGCTHCATEVYTESSGLAGVGPGLLWVTVLFWCGL